MSDWSAPRVRGRLILVAYVAFCALYLGAARFAIGVPYLLQASAIDRAVPFLPWTIAIYASQFLLLYLSLALVEGRTHLARMLTAYAVATILSVAVFIAWPTTIARPGRAVGLGAFRLLYFFDVDTNCFPSLHVSLAALAAFLWPRRRTRPLVAAWAFIIALSTMTTKQHVAIDIAAGIGVALIALVVSGAINAPADSRTR